ncbi:MAG: SulP family inorganic anion transporter, partial [Flavobacteriales bacterium]
MTVNNSAVFTNFLGLKKGLAKLPAKQHVEIDFSNCTLVDHTVMKNVSQFMKEYNADGGKLSIIGLNNHKSLSHDALSTKKLVK